MESKSSICKLFYYFVCLLDRGHITSGSVLFFSSQNISFPFLLSSFFLLRKEGRAWDSVPKNDPSVRVKLSPDSHSHHFNGSVVKVGFAGIHKRGGSVETGAHREELSVPDIVRHTDRAAVFVDKLL